MSDLFHDGVPDSFIRAVFSTIERADWHVFQILTKRAERLARIADALPWPPNLWMGVSVESARYAFRARLLADTPALAKFISAEPLLGPIPDLPLRGINWVIVGGESGRFARPMDLSWARDLRDQCKSAGVPFFLKQLGGRRGKRGGEEAVLDGRRWRESPPLHLHSFSEELRA
jgi:protein gp37